MDQHQGTTWVLETLRSNCDFGDGKGPIEIIQLSQTEVGSLFNSLVISNDVLNLKHTKYFNEISITPMYSFLLSSVYSLEDEHSTYITKLYLCNVSFISDRQSNSAYSELNYLFILGNEDKHLISIEQVFRCSRKFCMMFYLMLEKRQKNNFEGVLFEYGNVK